MPRTPTEKDPEIEAMRAIAAALETLDPGPRRRVLAWLDSRYPLDDFLAVEYSTEDDK